MLDRFVDAAETLTGVLDVVEGPPAISVQRLQIVFDLGVCSLHGKEARNSEEDRNLWNPTVDCDLESLDKKDRNATTTRYLFTKKLLMRCMKSESRRMYGTEHVAELGVRRGWIKKLRILNSGERAKF